MKNKIIYFLGIMSLFVMMFSTGALGSVTSEITTTNNTESNTQAVSIIVLCYGNATQWNVTLLGNSSNNYTGAFSSIDTTTLIANNTNTTLTTNSLTVSSNYAIKAQCWNYTVDASVANSSIKSFEINQRPTISVVTVTEGYRPKGSSITFTVTWSDTNSSGTDGNQVYICPTNSYTQGSGCASTQLGATSSDETDGSSTVSYTIPTSKTAGQHVVYTFAEDNNDYASTGTPVTYRVAGSSDGTPSQEEDEQYFEDNYGSGSTDDETEGFRVEGPVILGMHWIIWVMIFIVGLIFLVKWAKSNQ